eukprot:gene5022-biopygen6208
MGMQWPGGNPLGFPTFSQILGSCCCLAWMTLLQQNPSRSGGVLRGGRRVRPQRAARGRPTELRRVADRGDAHLARKGCEMERRAEVGQAARKAAWVAGLGGKAAEVGWAFMGGNHRRNLSSK